MTCPVTSDTCAAKIVCSEVGHAEIHFILCDRIPLTSVLDLLRAPCATMGCLSKNKRLFYGNTPLLPSNLPQFVICRKLLLLVPLLPKEAEEVVVDSAAEADEAVDAAAEAVAEAAATKMCGCL